MANYMAEVAKLLGVELGEIFEYENLPDIPFKLTETGLVCLGPDKLSRDIRNEALVRLLIGCSKIKRKPWKPKKEEYYWNVRLEGEPWLTKWLDDIIDYNNYKLGNCYRTKAEAEENRDKWSRFYASDEVLEV